MKNLAERIIGIDLGTSNSAAAIIQGGKPTIIPSAEGQTAHGKAFPSVVAFTKDDDKIIRLVGTPAVNQAVTNPENTITKVKRKMGSIPPHVYKIFDKEYKPEEISAAILQKIKKDAEAFTGDKITKAVITVPAYFNDNERQATKDAGTIAGLEVERIINEPTAAALAFGLDKAKQDMKILVFDFGGGTLDVTIMEMGGGVFEVMSTKGDTKLGGTDMDLAIMKHVQEEFRKKTAIDLSNDKKAMERLREACEKAKIQLSGVMETDINLPYIHEKTALEVKLTRAKLDSLVTPLVERCKPSIDSALQDAKISTSEITKIVLVGGPTRMPIVKKFVADAIGKEAESGVDPMEAVAFGAAVQAGILAGDVESDIVLLDVTPLTLGIETLGGVREPIIERNTTIPTSKDKTFTTAADSQTAVTINVVQGERPMVADNVSLGSFNLTDIPPAPRGVPQINVKFDIDANGIINVTAKDLGTGKDAKITIESTTKLSDEEVEKLKEDAEKHADEDKKKKETVDIKNEAESFIYTTEKLVNQDLKDKISQEQGIKVTDAIKELKEVLSQDADQIKTKLDALKAIFNEITTELYKNATPPPGADQQKDETKSEEKSEPEPEPESKPDEDKSK